MKKVIALVVAIIVLGGGGYALAKHHKNDTTAMNMSTSTNTASSTSNAITISDFAFSPASTTVKKGTTITWTNKDSVAHTVQETDGQDGPKSGNLDQGKSYSFTYNAAGTFKYHCSIHPDMTGSVTVTD